MVLAPRCQLWSLVPTFRQPYALAYQLPFLGGYIVSVLIHVAVLTPQGHHGLVTK